MVDAESRLVQEETPIPANYGSPTHPAHRLTENVHCMRRAPV